MVTTTADRWLQILGNLGLFALALGICALVIYSLLGYWNTEQTDKARRAQRRAATGLPPRSAVRETLMAVLVVVPILAALAMTGLWTAQTPLRPLLIAAPIVLAVRWWHDRRAAAAAARINRH